ncbi:MAG: hypothetical protein OEZ68_11625 [Gammaproteobacteria bacterium]|nr:hypothetical protein [Gammaproteobacteria bacterium]MDH5801443.1 hypothetical protein [Gammaproteobacteria bacterium]
MPLDAPDSAVGALAVLLSDRDLRQRFVENPLSVLPLWSLPESEQKMLLQLRADQLNIQAAILIRKRLREVAKWIPLTIEGLGADAYALFDQYAECYWPHTHRRHQEDAKRFCEHLKTKGYPYNRSEYNRVRFENSSRRCAVTYAGDAWVHGRKTAVLQFMVRRKQQPQEWRFYIRA